MCRRLHLHQLERKRAWQEEEEEEEEQEEEEEIRKVTIVCVCRPWVGDRLQRRGARALWMRREPCSVETSGPRS